MLFMRLMRNVVARLFRQYKDTVAGNGHTKAVFTFEMHLLRAGSVMLQQAFQSINSKRMCMYNTSHINKYTFTFIVMTTKNVNNSISLWLIEIIFETDM